jgi:hypothetical protein
VTFEERAAAVARRGFTERQARFLVTVMLHSGVCMLRNYCAFAGIVCGQKARDFFKDLVDRRFATAYPCAHGRARIFHVHRRGLYQSIGERDSRLRRPTPIARAVERLMVLDAVLATTDVTWLATERDKLEYFTLLLKSRLERDELPHLTFGVGTAKTIRYFPDRLPIGVHADGQTRIFTYLMNRDVPIDFRPFLRRHAPLLRALPRWRVRLFVPSHLADAVALYQAAWLEELGRPLRLSTADELRWYFEHRRCLAEAKASPDCHDETRYARARDAFGAPRYQVLYRSWLQHGPVALKEVVSPVLADAIARGTGQFETVMLSHPYMHLAPLVTTA